MFGSDDDIDFIPGTNSKLDSLFSGAKSDGENASFTFAAPKQPKKGILKDDRKPRSEVTITQGRAPTEVGPEKLSIIIVRAVHVFLLVDGQYTPQGKLGAAVLGNASQNIYQLLLYKGKQQHVTSTKITPAFSFCVQANNYGSFYNDQGQNWSIHFSEVADCEEFAREIALARAASQGGDKKVLNLITQDLSVPNESESDKDTANNGDMVEVFYSVKTYASGKLGSLVESNSDAKKPQKVKIQKNVWEEGLIGISRGVKRILMLPPNIVGPWTKLVPEGTSLVIEVVAGRMKQVKLSRPTTPSRPTSPRLPSFADSAESALESSADDSIRARGATISQALSSSPRTNKASLISRMARMGQATLPLRGAISCNPSDSEETGDESSSRSAKGASLKPVKGRMAKARPMTSHQIAQPDIKSPSTPQQVMVYQSMPTPWQQQAMMDGYGMGRTYQTPDGRSYAVPPSSTSMPVFASPSTCDTLSSPASDISVFLSETRTHNTEVRMAVSKVADKVDQVLGKMDSVVASRSSSTVALMDNSTLMTTIQKMITENEQLKLELDDKRAKVEAQNDKIYQLLNTKQQYMEQSSSASSQEVVVAGLRDENAKLTAELSALKEKANAMLLREEKNQNSWEKQIFELKDIIKRLQLDLDGKNDSKINIHDKVKEIEKLQESLAAMQSLKEEAEKKLSTAEKELATTKNEAAHQLKGLAEKYSSQISMMESQSDLMKKQFEMLKTRTSEAPDTQTANKVRTVMNAVWKALQAQFSLGTSYEGEAIRKTLMVTIRDVTNQHVNINGGSPAKDVKGSEERAKEVKIAAAPVKETNPTPPPQAAKTAATFPQTSPPPKDFKSASDTKSPDSRVATVRTPSPPPKEAKASTLAPTENHAAPAKIEVGAKAADIEKPTPAERKIPVPEVTVKAKSAAGESEAVESSVKNREGAKLANTHETQISASECKSMPEVQTSPKQKPKLSPKQSPKMSPKQSPKPSPKQSPKPSPKLSPRKANQPNENKSEDLIAGENKAVGDVDVKPVVAVKQVAQAKNAALATKIDEPEGWRPEPPPLFDTDDDDDTWLA